MMNEDNSFHLDRALVNWRRQMASKGVSNPGLLDELESHLREDASALMAAGTSGGAAFELAVARLGPPGSLRAEFGKVRNPACWPVRIGSWMFAAAMVLVAVGVWRRVMAGKISLLLGVHVVFVTVGYVAAFLAGGFAVLYVCCRLFRSLPPNRQRSLDRAVLLCSLLTAGTVIVGYVLGMIWCRQHIGRFLMYDVKEFGALCVIVWFGVLAAMRSRSPASERAAMLMSVAGNIVVSLAWFGSALMDGNRLPAFAPFALSIFVGFQFVFIVMGLAPVREAAEGPSAD